MNTTATLEGPLLEFFVVTVAATHGSEFVILSLFVGLRLVSLRLMTLAFLAASRSGVAWGARAAGRETDLSGFMNCDGEGRVSPLSGCFVAGL